MEFFKNGENKRNANGKKEGHWREISGKRFDISYYVNGVKYGMSETYRLISGKWELRSRAYFDNVKQNMWIVCYEQHQQVQISGKVRFNDILRIGLWYSKTINENTQEFEITKTRYYL